MWKRRTLSSGAALPGTWRAPDIRSSQLASRKLCAPAADPRAPGRGENHPPGGVGRRCILSGASCPRAPSLVWKRGLAWRLVALALSPASASMLNDVEHGRSDVTAHRLLRRSGRGLNGTVNVSMRRRGKQMRTVRRVGAMKPWLAVFRGLTVWGRSAHGGQYGIARGELLPNRGRATTPGAGCKLGLAFRPWVNLSYSAGLSPNRWSPRRANFCSCNSPRSSAAYR